MSYFYDMMIHILVILRTANLAAGEADRLRIVYMRSINYKQASDSIL
jgi:hypothetical protein